MKHGARNRRLFAVAIVAILGLVVLAAPAGAQQDAGTSAVVGGLGNVPVIQCAWALSDTDHNWNSSPKMQYGPDDEPSTSPPGATPCQASGAVATQPSGAGPLIHVQPNAHDEPTQAYVELWAAITSPTANPIAYFDVYHPDGTFKVQVDATRYADQYNPARCNDIDVTGPMFTAAQATGQMTAAAADNIKDECMFQQKGLWYGAFGISKHQPYGLYTIVLHAALAGGGESTLSYTIAVKSFYQLEKDFTSVNFGGASPNTHSFQPTAGDLVWDGANNAANQATSVRNTGNAGIALNTQFASMCLTTAASCSDDKRIDHFDAKFGKSLPGLQSIGNGGLATALVSDLGSVAKPAPLGPVYNETNGGFDNDIQRTLCPNDVGKIEFSLWTENIQAGTYTASPIGIRLSARPNPICPTDLTHVYNYTTPTPTSNDHHPI